MSGRFKDVPLLPPDAIIDLNRQIKADNNPCKVDLGVGAYRDSHGRPYILNVVKAAEARVIADPTYNHEYVPIEGWAPFRLASQQVLFGATHPVLAAGKLATVQALSGTGALRIGYTSGSLEDDAYSVRLFASLGMELFCACSFAKNMGLYGERVGALHALVSSPAEAQVLAFAQVLGARARTMGPACAARMEEKERVEGKMVMVSSSVAPECEGLGAGRVGTKASPQNAPHL
eukprot:evm.model.NODE_50841_length_62998_cov_26.109304.19